MSLPKMKPRPDCRAERKQSQSVFEFERPLGRLVSEDNHAGQSAGPAADCAEQHQRQFGDALARSARAPFVVTEREERHHVDGGEPDERD